MKVGMYYNNKDVRIEELPVPEIGDNDILIKVMASGICGSDIMEWYRIKRAPLVLGHEITGKSVKVGKNINKFSIGDRVFSTHHVPCDKCYYCLHGHNTACETFHKINNFDPGGFSEYIRVPAINVDRGVFPIPDEMTFDQAAFIEPLACVIRGQRLVDLKPGQTVVVIGSGISGLLHILLAKALGAGRIIATDIDDDRLARAKEMGADVTINAKDDVPGEIFKANDNRLADLVIVCTGAMPAFKQSLKSVDRGGTILAFATSNPGEDLPVPLNDFWRNEIKLMPSYGNAPIDAAQAIELIRAGRVDVDQLITHRISLSEIQEGFKMTTTGHDSEGKSSLKVIVELNK